MPPRIGILMEFCPRGDLKAFLQKYREEEQHGERVEQSEKLRILIEVASAMLYLHTKSIIHRDLKCENILITENLNSKLMDFGLSKMLREKQLQKNNMTKMVGTSCYMSPEVTLGSKYNEKCDVFSYGILIYVVMTEKFQNPYGTDQDLFNIEIKVANSPNFRPQVTFEEEDAFELEGVREGRKRLISLMKSCWEHESEDRPSFIEVLTEMTKMMNGKEGILKNNLSSKNKPKKDEMNKNPTKKKWMIEKMKRELEELKLINEQLKKELQIEKERKQEQS